jgi:hypothetical protein
MFVYPPWIVIGPGLFCARCFMGENYHKAWRRDLPRGLKLHWTRLVENYHKAWRLGQRFGRPRDPNFFLLISIYFNYKETNVILMSSCIFYFSILDIVCTIVMPTAM